MLTIDQFFSFWSWEKKSSFRLWLIIVIMGPAILGLANSL